MKLVYSFTNSNSITCSLEDASFGLLDELDALNLPDGVILEYQALLLREEYSTTIGITPEIPQSEAAQIARDIVFKKYQYDRATKLAQLKTAVAELSEKLGGFS